jgi:hypothetical protein
MRILRFFLDLPWWAGLPVFLAGTAIVVHWYAIGLMIALFGAWTFSKLLPPDRDAADAIGFTLAGLPLFFFAMLIPAQFCFELPLLDWLNGISPTATYATRSALGLGVALCAFRGFR